MLHVNQAALSRVGVADSPVLCGRARDDGPRQA